MEKNSFWTQWKDSADIFKPGKEEIADEAAAFYVCRGADGVACGEDLHVVAGGEGIEPAEFAAGDFI